MCRWKEGSRHGRVRRGRAASFCREMTITGMAGVHSCNMGTRVLGFLLLFSFQRRYKHAEGREGDLGDMVSMLGARGKLGCKGRGAKGNGFTMPKLAQSIQGGKVMLVPAKGTDRKSVV